MAKTNAERQAAYRARLVAAASRLPIDENAYVTLHSSTSQELYKETSSANFYRKHIAENSPGSEHLADALVNVNQRRERLARALATLEVHYGVQDNHEQRVTYWLDFGFGKEA